MSASGRSVEDEAWVTLATNDTYALGALVLANSLRRVGTSRKLAVLVTPGVTTSMRDQLSQVFDLVQEVNVLDSNDTANLALLTRPELGVTFTKLHCWRLTQYKKCVFMDADTLVIRNCDEIFDHEELSAAPDVGWPDCFNSGVFVFSPSDVTYQSLLECAVTAGSFDGGDQGLLNIFFSDWATKDISKHLPFIYNMTSSVAYSYLPAYLYFGKDVKIVHFIGPIKPWLHRFNTTTGKVEPAPGAFHALEHLQFWWDIFMQDVKEQLQPDLAGLAGQLALITLGQEISPEQRALEDRARQFSWEQGQIDYLGADAFTNIQKKLDETLVHSTAPQQVSTQIATVPTATGDCDVAVPATAPSVQAQAVPELDSSVLKAGSGEPVVSSTRIEVSLGSPAVVSKPEVIPTSQMMPPSASVGEAEPEVAAAIADSKPSLQLVAATPLPVAIALPQSPPAVIALPSPPAVIALPSPPAVIALPSPPLAASVVMPALVAPSKPTQPLAPVSKPTSPPIVASQSVESPPVKMPSGTAPAAAPAPAPVPPSRQQVPEAVCQPSAAAAVATGTVESSTPSGPVPAAGAKPAKSQSASKQKAGKKPKNP